jgi:hypothetical protein
MVIVMNLQRRTWRRASLLISTLLISTLMAAGVRAASLAEVKSVYLFPMSHGLDQYLAERLTHDHVLQVVTDPKAADAVITDRLGDAFEQELLKVRPELKPVPPPKPVKKDDDKDADKDKKDEQAVVPVVSSFHAARGTVFLVNAKTQQVVWSVYQKPGNYNSRDMERTATRITKLLEKDMTPPVAAPIAASVAPVAAPVVTTPAKK